MVSQMQTARVDVADVYVNENNVPTIRLVKTGTLPVKVNVWAYNSTFNQWDLSFSGRLMKEEMIVNLTSQDFSVVVYGPLGLKGNVVMGDDFPFKAGGKRPISSVSFLRAKVASPISALIGE